MEKLKQKQQEKDLICPKCKEKAEWLQMTSEGEMCGCCFTELLSKNI